MAGIEDFTAAIAIAFDRLNDAIAGMESARSAAGESATSLQAAGAYGAADIMARVAEVIGEAVDTLATGKTNTEEAAAIARAAMETTDGGDTPAGTTPPPDGGPPAPTPTRPHPNAADTRHVAAVRRIGWPKNAQGRTNARALVFDKNGEQVGDVWKATPDGEANDPRHYREPWRSDVRYTIRYHVEGQVAAMMRRTGITEAEVYLNIPPCGTRDDDWSYQCHDNIKKILPKGYTMTVWAVREREAPTWSPQKYTYKGNGEALA
ncbi:nucleic acid/nucleotide deaminase of polymorphic system toxin [Stackebrandtia albiflava]|uniref:Nucleic acid/nucleotide deaminase of polymorphic system toxin n=1 Tax=Stackebrandtia albiflava TaxID=406432 RepID=A0A562V204_9ACTN|nr:DddA-like double-stranded DNA deaminase toxin [Stackebrandtia albiflava]TWJ11929.1 nucleic acid/nucleotide deaminase of polymorphic system toxin [Stackebrandtia albiflava]